MGRLWCDITYHGGEVCEFSLDLPPVETLICRLIIDYHYDHVYSDSSLSARNGDIYICIYYLRDFIFFFR